MAALVYQKGIAASNNNHESVLQAPPMELSEESMVYITFLLTVNCLPHLNRPILVMSSLQTSGMWHGRSSMLVIRMTLKTSSIFSKIFLSSRRAKPSSFYILKSLQMSVRWMDSYIYHANLRGLPRLSRPSKTSESDEAVVFSISNVFSAKK